MIDPFFLDRLMHVFTTAHATPLGQTAAPDRRGEPGANSGVPSVPPRVVAEAAAVGAWFGVTVIVWVVLAVAPALSVTVNVAV